MDCLRRCIYGSPERRCNVEKHGPFLEKWSWDLHQAVSELMRSLSTLADNVLVCRCATETEHNLSLRDVYKQIVCCKGFHFLTVVNWPRSQLVGNIRSCVCSEVLIGFQTETLDKRQIIQCTSCHESMTHCHAPEIVSHAHLAPISPPLRR